MNEQYVEERIEQYSNTRILYEDFAGQVLTILKAIIKQEYPDIKIASYSKRAKEVESLRKKLRKDKYNENSEITDLAGVRIITYSKKDIPFIAAIIEKSFDVDIQNSVDKTLVLGNDKVGYRGDHFVVSFCEDRVRLPENKKFKGLKCEIQVTSLIAHTWSEITHEKGYKFEGELPEDLERRKNLLAGMLELADLEMDAYVESFDKYVSKIEQEIEKGCLKSPINSKSLERYMAWKFPNISPQVFRDVDLILNELKLFGLSTIKELNELVRSEYEKEIQEAEWRSLDGMIRNILIIDNANQYFTKVWNPSMNQMNKKNYELYQRFDVDIDRICKEHNICIV
ncbi:MAG: hypothetical protein HDR15_00670 [Lachnospiraceae bacterium]|nr:hypothetical protein [Lachnospiraceae bacterium]